MARYGRLSRERGSPIYRELSVLETGSATNLMSLEQFEQYQQDPIKMDRQVRTAFEIPDNKYYTVSVWPEQGVVRVNPYLSRAIKTEKISKST